MGVIGRNYGVMRDSVRADKKAIKERIPIGKSQSACLNEYMISLGLF